MSIKKTIILAFVLFSLLAIPVLAQTIKDKPAEVLITSLEKTPTELSLEEQVVYFSKLYGGDANIISKVMECESGGNQSAVGDEGRSRGVMQFQKPTFDSLSGKIGENLDINSSYDQIKLATWAISNGHGRSWTAYRAIMNGGVYSFYSNQLKRSFTVYCR